MADDTTYVESSKSQEEIKHNFQPFTSSAKVVDLRLVHPEVYRELDLSIDPITHADLQLDNKLGHGSFSNVFEATLMLDLKKGYNGTRVAVKVLNDCLRPMAVHCELVGMHSLSVSKQGHMLDSDKDTPRYHPKLIGYNVSVPPFFIVMELISGPTLSEFINNHGRLSLPDIVCLSKQVLLGLAYAHSSGIIHRDIKPANIVLGMPPQTSPDSKCIAALCGAVVSIVDWGESTATWTHREMTPEVGTIRWMAPEMANLCKDDAITPYNCEVDIYSFGMILYECCSGTPPFAHFKMSLQVAFAVSRGMRPSFDVMCLEQCPALLEFTIRLCLHHNPKERPTIQQLSSLLDAMGNGFGTSENEELEESAMAGTACLEMFVPRMPSDLPGAAVLARWNFQQYVKLREEQEAERQ